MGDAQHLPKQEVFDVDIDAGGSGEHDEAEGEHAREYDTDGCVFADAGAPADRAHEQGDDDTGGDGGEEWADAKQEGDDHSGEDGVREGVAHECASSGDDIGAEDRAHYADQHGDYEGAHHEAVLKRAQYVINHDISLCLAYACLCVMVMSEVLRSEFDAVGTVHLFKHFGCERFFRGAVGADVVVDA